MNEIPDNYTEAFKHVQDNELYNKEIKQDFTKEKEPKLNLIICRSSFFVPYDRKKTEFNFNF